MANLTDGIKNHIFYGNMKWFSPLDQPDDFECLPRAFAEAKRLWDDNKKKNAAAILKLVSPYVKARFIASNISGWAEIFLDPEGRGLVEIEAFRVKVVGVDFKLGPIPLCKAEAKFIVSVSNVFDSIDLTDWQDHNGPFTDAVVFYWDLPDSDATDKLDLTYGSNLGTECVVLDMKSNSHILGN